MFLWPPARIVWLLARAHSKCQISSEFELLFSKIMSLVRNPSKYGVSSSHADEDTLPTTTQTSFFQKGREFESRYVNHHYTEEERQKLGTFESVDYLPPHSAVYKNWLKQQPSRLDWDRWVMMGMIGFTVGFIGFLMHQLIDVISEIKWDKASEFIEKRDFALAWVWVIGYSVLFVIASSVPVVASIVAIIIIKK